MENRQIIQDAAIVLPNDIRNYRAEIISILEDARENGVEQVLVLIEGQTSRGNLGIIAELMMSNSGSVGLVPIGQFVIEEFIADTEYIGDVEGFILG